MISFIHSVPGSVRALLLLAAVLIAACATPVAEPATAANTRRSEVVRPSNATA